MGIGGSAFGAQVVGYMSGGRLFGPGINGIVLPGGGNWSGSGRLGGDASVGTFDARAVWQTDDGDLIYLSYTGRNIIPDDVRATFADPAVPDADPSRYYLRRSEEHTSELQSLMRNSYAVFCLKKKNQPTKHTHNKRQLYV